MSKEGQPPAHTTEIKWTILGINLSFAVIDQVETANTCWVLSVSFQTLVTPDGKFNRINFIRGNKL